MDEHDLRCELRVIGDGEKAISYLDHIDASGEACPALVILDLNLPKRTGLDILKRMRSGWRCNAAPVVILSSSDADSDKSAALQLGADRYVRKPSLLEDFLRVGGILKEIIGRRGN